MNINLTTKYLKPGQTQTCTKKTNKKNESLTEKSALVQPGLNLHEDTIANKKRTIHFLHIISF